MKVYQNQTNKIIIILFLGLLIIATLFPPYEWKHDKEGVTYSYYGDYAGSSGISYYSYHSTPYKTYSLLFGKNREKFFSDITKKNENFSRSLIVSELIVEYLLIGLVGALVYIISKKGKLLTKA
jgi:hypothetical protein